MGQIEINHTGSGGTVVLSSDGTSLLLGGSAIGGGAALYAVNESSPAGQPSATGDNAVAIGDGAQATGSDSFALGNNSRSGATRSTAFAFSNAGGTNSFAACIGSTSNAKGALSTNSVAMGKNATAGGLRSAALGDEAVTGSNGESAVSLGTSYANGVDSFAAAIATNSSSYGASGANSIAMGYLSKATASGAVAIGDRNTASGDDAVVFGESNTGAGPFSFTAGKGNVNTGSRGIALGNANTVSDFYTFASGSQNTASQDYATAIGSKALANRQGKFAHGSLGFGTVGDSQYGRMILSKSTTNATPTVLSALQGNTPSTDNMPVIPLGGAQAFSGLLVAKQTSSANVAAWEIKGLIVNHLGTTTLVNSTITVINNTPSWSGPALSANNTNDWLEITCTGAVATSIRWSCTLNTSELIYA
jgi:trimeric autotransporter adhesin